MRKAGDLHPNGRQSSLHCGGEEIYKNIGGLRNFGPPHLDFAAKRWEKRNLEAGSLGQSMWNDKPDHRPLRHHPDGTGTWSA